MDLTLTQILADPVATQAFLKYAKRSSFEEQLQFFLAVEQYKAHPTLRDAQNIYGRYLTEGSPDFANVKGLDVDEVRRRLRPGPTDPNPALPPITDPPPADLFDRLYSQIRIPLGDQATHFSASPEGKPVVRTFLERVRDLENAVQEYKRDPSKAGAWKIFNKYLSDKAASPIVLTPERRAAILQRLPKRFRFRLPPPPQDLFDEAVTFLNNAYSSAAAKIGITLRDIGPDPAGAAAAADADHRSAERPRAPGSPPDTARQPGSGADKGLNLDGLGDDLAAAGAAAGGGESISGATKPPARPPDSQTQPAPQADFNSDRKPEEEKTGKEHAE